MRLPFSLIALSPDADDLFSVFNLHKPPINLLSPPLQIQPKSDRAPLPLPRPRLPHLRLVSHPAHRLCLQSSDRAQQRRRRARIPLAPGERRLGPDPEQSVRIRVAGALSRARRWRWEGDPLVLDDIADVLLWCGAGSGFQYWYVLYFLYHSLPNIYPVQNYYIDSFSKYAASAIAGGSVFRSLVGGIVPLFAPMLFDKLGFGWGISVFGFCAVVIAPSPVVFYYFGKRVRERFKIDGM